jgi:hypothetical protein
VTPIEGYGTLDITVMWNAEDTENPFIDSELIPYSGSSQALDFTVTGGNTATFHSDTVESGYHTLTVKLLDNGILTMGAVEIVRIVNDTLSQGTFEFYEINSTVGYIAVNIFPEMAEPLEVLISGQADKIEYGESMTVTASVLNDPGNTVYVWYINGESVGTGASLTVGNSLAAGVYRLDVTAFTADGKRGGSTTCMFHVMGIAPPIEWQKCLGGSEDDWADSIQQTSNNGYIIAGRTYSNNGDVPGNHGSIDLWVIKLK